MIIACPNCSTGYLLPEHLVGPAGARVRCPRCQLLFTVGVDGRFREPALPEPAPGNPASERPLEAVEEVPAAAATSPIMTAEPGARAEPEVDAEPGARAEPEVEAEPGAGAEPEVEAEPGAGAEPEVEAEPGAGAEPEVEVEPGAGAEPEVEAEPGAGAEPEVEAEPGAGAEPEAEGHLAVARAVLDEFAVHEGEAIERAQAERRFFAEFGPALMVAYESYRRRAGAGADPSAFRMALRERWGVELVPLTTREG